MKTKTGREIENLMDKNPNNWKGIFYFNKRDSRIFVPKSNPSLGWTLNFASPYAYLFLIAILAIVIISAFFL